MEILVLGTGCAKCKNVYSIVEKAIAEIGTDFILRKEEDIMKIMDYNIMSTPAVVIDGRVVVQGRVPTEKEVKEWISTSNKGDIKEMVKQRYNEVAMLPTADASKCCCNPAAPSKKVFTIMSEDYTKLKGYEPDADLGVGCGLPTQYAGIKQGDTVVDLGSGAGNDCFIAREEVGETGKVIGIDFAPNMLAKARANAERRGFKNIEFIEGDIENMPLPDSAADVVVSNCVLNLLPRKDKIFREIYRVLKPAGYTDENDPHSPGQIDPSELMLAKC